jgi:hypothetical protein
MAAAASAFNVSLRMNPVENSPCNDTVKQIAVSTERRDELAMHVWALREELHASLVP